MVWGLLGASAHQAFLVEPLLVARGSALGREPGYLRAVLRLHWLLAGALAALLAAGSSLPPLQSELGRELLAAAVFVLGVSQVRLVRGMAYAELPARAGSFAVSSYAALTALGVAGLAHFEVISGPLTLGVMGLAGTLGASVSLWRERLPPSDSQLAGRALAHHWRHGRWLLLLSPLRWALDSLPLVILGGVRPLAELAQLRAAVLVVAPAVQVMGAVRMMLIPRFVEALAKGTLPQLLWQTQLALGLACSAFAWLISAQAGSVLALVAPKYEHAAQLLPIVSLTPALMGAGLLFGNVLRATGRADLSARAFLIASLTATAAALVLCERWGATGAAISLALGYAALLASKAALAWSAVRSRRASA